MSELCLETSAIVAIAFEEPSAADLREAIENAERLVVGAATLFEACLVISRRTGFDAEARVLAFVRDLDVRVLPFDQAQFSLASQAFQRYGKGRHAAGLNFGDCLSYAAAKSRGARLLYVGGDFAQTDLA